MTAHNIIGSERSGAHVVIRRFKPAPRRTGFNQFLSAVGGLVIVVGFSIFIWTALA